ncbi:hypothetical protein P170DRAFT_426662 [Aspergillus steynii IBT 23096]|uniref:Uncharacterized protein n=1 Tax=Aspergillus steynii IBT 23096 TaxID=1392250 RepID=A0A2I2GA96_9EURO|nr:uncharacterized protein P170DRAFT_426662 [Aspergillus steynii IBT 23096]PLB49796.1 hypothetical protein P170DRAFT_426662 [Aspergillus steynii IBT 23096]
MFCCGCARRWWKGPSEATPSAEETNANHSPEASVGPTLNVTGNTNATETEAPENAPGMTARDIWKTAFEELRDERSTQSLVAEYEEFFRREHPDLLPEGESADFTLRIGDFYQCNPDLFLEKLTQARIKEIQDSGCTRDIFLAGVKMVDRIKKTVGEALSSCPPAAGGWALACLIAVPITQNLEQMNAHDKGLTHVISRLPWYSHLIELVNADTWSDKPTSPSRTSIIRKSLVDLYKLLVEYQLRSLRAHNRKWREILSNTVKWNDWEKSLDSIKELEKELMEHIEFCSQADYREKIHQMLKNTEGLPDFINQCHEERRNLRDNRIDSEAEIAFEGFEKFDLDESELDTITYDDYVAGIEKQETNTGHGVLEHQSYLEWKESERGALVVVARPGTGKSVLANHSRVCSFFFKDISRGQTDPTVALRKIFYELLQGLPRLPDPRTLKDIKKLKKKEIRLLNNKVWKIISRISRHHRVTIVLDGLDESDQFNRKRLLDRIGRFQSDFPDARVKFLLTTRPLSDLTDELEWCILNLDDDVDCRSALRSDILHVAKVKLENLAKDKGISRPKTEELLKILQCHQHSTYLFVKLLFIYVQKFPAFDQDWAEVFKTVPTTVYQAYKALLETVSEDDIPYVRAIIQIVLAATRPLSVMELQIAVKLTLRERRHCETEDDLSLHSDWLMENIVRQKCGFLLDVVAGRVYFLHQTVKDYLVSEEDESQFPGWLPKSDLANCHGVLANACMKYISLPFIANNPGFKAIEEYMILPRIAQLTYHTWCRNNFLFGKYAFSSWIVHFAQKHKETQDSAALLDIVIGQFGCSLVDLAVSIFCCSSLPTLEEAQVLQNALPKDYADKTDIFNSLSQGFIQKSFSAGVSADLRYGIDLARLAIAHTSDCDPKLGRRLGILAQGLTCKYERRESSRFVGALIEAMLTSEKAVERSVGDPDRANALIRRASVLRLRFKKSHHIRDIDRAILDAHEAVDIGHDIFFHTIELALTLCDRAVARDADDDLKKAMDSMEKILETVPDIPQYLSAGSVAMGHCFHSRYLMRGNLEDLEKAADRYREAVLRFPTTSNGVIPQCKKLVLILRTLFQKTKDTKFLTEGIKFLEQRRELLDKSHPDYPTVLQHFIASCSVMREDLDRACSSL